MLNKQRMNRRFQGSHGPNWFEFLVTRFSSKHFENTNPIFRVHMQFFRLFFDNTVAFYGEIFKPLAEKRKTKIARVERFKW